MKIIHPELLRQTLASKGASVKFLLSDTTVVFFPLAVQHRDCKAHGLSYEDDYKGNALAGLVTAEGAQIRYHEAYADERVRSIWSRLRTLPEFADGRLGRLSYQGRQVLP
ncbi:hypothetical protein [Prosthecobacter sp.]|uniref:hypothetical protein n=1 Tax=Prosthecobacter sp. TaxID=1965333 RepID=UPI003783922B